MTAALLALGVAVAGLTGCTADTGTSDAATSNSAGSSNSSGSLNSTSSNAASSRSAPGAPESPALAAIRATIEAINATAGGPVTAQRAVLDDLATEDQSAEQHRCPVATNTLAFDPAYGDLRPAPDDPSHTFLLPTYITIYSGDRIVGSDLANLTLRIVDGRARTAALCVA